MTLGRLLYLLFLVLYGIRLLWLPTSFFELMSARSKLTRHDVSVTFLTSPLSVIVSAPRYTFHILRAFGFPSGPFRFFGLAFTAADHEPQISGSISSAPIFFSSLPPPEHSIW